MSQFKQLNHLRNNYPDLLYIPICLNLNHFNNNIIYVVSRLYIPICLNLNIYTVCNFTFYFLLYIPICLNLNL